MKRSKKILENIVAIEDAGFSYPNKNCSPSECYPEYPWMSTDISDEKNLVYDAVRKCFMDLEMDKDNYGKSTWNPFGDIIQEGDNVLIKPNFVVSDHPQLECIVTNPAITRAVIDYVCIALKGTGRIIVGDAPMQRCNFYELLEKSGYNRLIHFYEEKNVSIEFVDFRNFISDYSSDNVKILKNDDFANDSFVAVDLGKESLHCLKDKYYKRYRVTNYDYRKMKNYHNPKHHIYLIHKQLLEADVVINLPKPKTHRKAGYTGALKNVVGTIVHKECLPHHIKGSVSSGGDEYLKRDFFKCARTFLYERIDLANIYNKKRMLPLLRQLLKISDWLVGKYKRDSFSEGSWYGNDTIWRTFGDINRCLLYADKWGKLGEDEQRQFITIADMVIAGEKDGPVHASPKEVGKIIAGINSVAVDYLIVWLMGFDYEKIPALVGLAKEMKYPLWTLKRSDIDVVSSIWDKKKINGVLVSCDFKASSGWKSMIEMEKLQ